MKKEFLHDINHSLLRGGKKELRNCITKYFFGAHRICTIKYTNDQEAAAIIDNYVEKITEAFSRGGLPEVDREVETLNKAISF